MSYRSRVYRQRNPQSQEEPKKQTTTSKGRDAKQSNSPVQTKLAINKPGDSYEKEADAVAGKVTGQKTVESVVQQKEISNIQRASSSGEEEKVSTAEGRMEKDKEIQKMTLQKAETEKEKKVQKKDEPKKEEDKAIQKKDEPKKEEDKAIQKKDEPKKEQEKLQK